MKQCNYNKALNDNFRIISVLNYGAFISDVSLGYYYKGKFYEFHNPYLLVLQEFKMNIPVEATKVELKVYARDLIRGSILLFDNQYDVADDACFLLWGISFDPKYKKIPCEGPSLIKDIFPHSILIQPEVFSSGYCSTNYLSSRNI